MRNFTIYWDELSPQKQSEIYEAIRQDVIDEASYTDEKGNELTGLDALGAEARDLDMDVDTLIDERTDERLTDFSAEASI